MQIRDYALSLKETTEGFPFGDGVLVFKVMGKIFCFSFLMDEEESICLKCDPEIAPSLAERFSAIEPTFNKKHWIKLFLNRDLRVDEIYKLVEHSYSLVVLKQPKSKQALYPSLSDVAYVPIDF